MAAVEQKYDRRIDVNETRQATELEPQIRILRVDSLACKSAGIF